jgi:outer membrane protein assembly factor BamB
MCLAGMSGGQAMKFASPHVSTGDELIYGGELTLLRRGALAGAGEWRSQWGSYDQTGVGAETLVHLPLEMLWFGGPGPDRMLDRHWGTTTPLSVGGRVFVTGQNHVLCVDAYNGREWWTRPIREVARRNASWNTGGMVADDDSLYVAKEGICLRLDQATGKTLAIYRVPPGAVRGASAGDEPNLPPVDVAWPTAWRAFGPVPSTVPLLDGNDLKTIPAELPAGGVRYPARTLAVAGGVLDFSNLYGGYGFAPLAAGEKPGPSPRGKGKRDYDTVEKAVYVMAEIRCEKAGKLTIGAGCDWWMAWYLDGKRIFDTLKGGNEFSPNQITDHVFSTNVTAGPHVLAVLVRAGSAGWSLASAGGSKYEPQITGGFGAAGPEWGAIMVLGTSVLGTCVEKGSATGEAASLFALGRDDGAVRWVRHARGAVLHAGLAAGDGKLFVLEAPLREDLWKVRRRGMSADANQTLTALDGETGKELWQRKGVRSGRLDTVQYSQGTVVVGGSKAYAASGGQPLWEDKEGDYRASARPVIVNGRIITHPDGVDLRTGRPLMIADPLTGLPRPWKYVRAYGCGSVVGCQDVLLFRSGMMGFLDLLQDGTTTYGGLKPNCSVNMIAAGGLVIVPEGASGCSCSYNFQTSIALAPVTARIARPTTGPATAPAATAAANQPWYVFYGQSPEGPVKQLRVSFGSPGDRRRGSETWLGWPRPSVRGAQPAPITVGPMDPNYVHAAADCSAVRGEAPAWVYASHLAGRCTIAVSVWGEGRSSEYDDFSGTMVPQWGTRSTTGGVAAPSTATAPAGPVERSFTVRLHFLEPSDLPVGARTFDVSIQGRCLLPAFDIVKSAGAPRRAVVAEIKGIRADRTLNIELKPRKGTPILSGMEVLAEPGN